MHCPFVVARGDGSELLELGEEVLDQIAGLVEISVVGTRLLAVALALDPGYALGCVLARISHRK